jgi:hypothetical protein
MNKLARPFVAVATVMGTIVGMAVAASAQTTSLDGVTTEVTGARDDLVSFVTGTGVPVLFSLLILGVGIALAVRYTRRGARSA